MTEKENEITQQQNKSDLSYSGSPVGIETNEKIESRLHDFRNQMTERVMAARAEAEKKNTLSGYEYEYRQKLTALKKRKSAEMLEKEKQDAERLLLLRREEREREIAEFIRREKEEADARAQKSLSLIETASSRPSMQKDLPRDELNLREELPRGENPTVEIKAEAETQITDSENISAPLKDAGEPFALPIISDEKKPEAEKNVLAAEPDSAEEDLPSESAQDTSQSTTDEAVEADSGLVIKIKEMEAPKCDTNRLLTIPELTVRATPVAMYHSDPNWNERGFSAFRDPDAETAKESPRTSSLGKEKPAVNRGQSDGRQPLPSAIESAIEKRKISDSEYLARLQRLSDLERDLLKSEEERILREIDEIKAQRVDIENKRKELCVTGYGSQPSDLDSPLQGGRVKRATHYIYPTEPEDSMPRDSYIDGEVGSYDENDELKRLGLSDADARALSEYEKHLSNGKASKKPPESRDLPVTEPDVGALPPEPVFLPMEKENASPADKEFDLPDLDLEKIANEQKNLDKSELPFRLNQFHKEADIYSKRILKLSKKQKNVSHTENVKLIVEKIGNARVVIEIYEEALLACLYTGSKKLTSTHKNILEKKIAAYNAIIDEYEEQTGKSLTRLSRSFASEIIRSREPKPIPIVRYIGEKNNDVQVPDPIDTLDFDSNDRDGEVTLNDSPDSQEEIEDQLRFLKEYEYDQRARDEDAGSLLSLGEDLAVHDKKMAAKKREEKLKLIKEAKERDELVIKARTEYNVARLEAKRDLLSLSFSTSKRDLAKEISAVNDEIDRHRSHFGKSLKLEREDNNCYYKLFTEKKSDKKFGKKTDRRRLESIRMRLDVLLAERDEINKTLITMYGVTGKKISKDERRINAVKRRHAKAMYHRQRKDAKRLEKLHAPLDLKQKVYNLMNQCTEIVSTLEGAKYKNRKTSLGSPERKALRRDIKKMRRDLKTTKSDIKYLMKKVEKHHDSHSADIQWIGWIIFLLILVIGGIILWNLYADVIWKYIGWLFG